MKIFCGNFSNTRGPLETNPDKDKVHCVHATLA